nr:MAG TPA: hypothetical protein [Bacteriophage sp.]
MAAFAIFNIYSYLPITSVVILCEMTAATIIS